MPLALVSAACAEVPDGQRDESFLVTDSAGVVIAESFRPAWGDGGGWRVVAEPELSIGAGATGGEDPDNPAFGSIRGVQVLSDGRIAVGDRTVDHVFVFDASGRFSHRFGGEGEGPGKSTVLSQTGEWLGTVELADGLELEQVVNGRVYGVHRNELGIATVRVHRVEKGGDAS